MTEYELYIERRWEADQARYQWERKAMLRGLGWGTLFSNFGAENLAFVLVRVLLETCQEALCRVYFGGS